MSLPAAPPRYSSWTEMVAPIKQGEEGWRAYAVQVIVGAARDGSWGPATEQAVRAWQKRHGLTVDGVAGPLTQRDMLLFSAARVEEDTPDLLKDVLKGYIYFEGAGILAATNWYTPPDGVPGVDVGCAQWRQYGPPFPHHGLLAAFDARASLQYSAGMLLKRVRDLSVARPALGRRRLWEVSVLAHNAPFLYRQVLERGRLTTPDAVAVWTTKPGGGHYTHREWSQVYPEKLLGFTTL